jgi:hypothetical protein
MATEKNDSTRAQSPKRSGVTQMAADVSAALAAPKLSLPRRRVIAAVMLALQCSFEEADGGLRAAVEKHISEGYSCSWNDTSVTVWVQQACMWVCIIRERQERGRPGNVVELFPGGAS